MKKENLETEKLLAETKVIREITRSLLWAKDEPELYQQICNFLTQIDGLKFVWIGLMEKGSFVIKPVAHAGFEQGYLSSIKVTYDESDYGNGPTGIAIKTKQPFIMKDITNDPKFGPWRKEAMKRDYGSSIAVPLVHMGEVIGTLTAYAEKKDAFGDKEVNFLSEVASDIAMGIKSLRLEVQLKEALESLKKTLEGTVNALGSALSKRDPYTAGHQQRVSQLACFIARKIMLSEEQVEGLRVAGLLHDIGKIYVPAEILSKPGRLTESEFNIMKTHPQVGYDILKTVEFPWPVALTILQHHERLNGSGYPDGLSGEAIILEAKILGVADVVEAMSSHRPYRPALGLDKALKEISTNRAILYDPRVVDICLLIFEKNKFQF